MLTSGNNSAYVNDDTMKAWRRTNTGHRYMNFDGTDPKSTRRIALTRPWLAIYELWARREAQRFYKPSK